MKLFRRKYNRQLPDSMQDCTILFIECEKGHGRLSAKNWLDHGCPHCAIEEQQKQIDWLKSIDKALGDFIFERAQHERDEFAKEALEDTIESRQLKVRFKA